MNSPSHHQDKLWIVMPVYNEETVVGPVVREWMSTLVPMGIDFTLCVFNDGSRDGTMTVLNELAQEFPNLKIVDKPNSGHAQTCLFGYRLALANGADWVFQIDSDGQCDPRFFPSFWNGRENHKLVYGFRAKRDDGQIRFLMSRIVSMVMFAATGVWVHDANVPYRLMHRSCLEGVVDGIAEDVYLANILLSALHQNKFGIHWIDIRFRDRIGGTSTVNTQMFMRHGVSLFQQCRNNRHLFRKAKAETTQNTASLAS